MKQYFLQHILLCLCLLAGTQITFAYDAQIDGIYYDFSGNEATVTYQKNEDWNYISDYSGDVVIPESVTYNGRTYSVTTIGYSAFSGCSSLTSVTIPNNVTSIGYFAFDGCSSLTSVTIPNSVTSIGYFAFDGCSSLTSVNIPESVTGIGSYAFMDCSSLTSVTIGNGVTSIGEYAFEGCSGLTSVTIPESVTSIGSSAFYGCSGLTSISVESGNTKYDSRDNCNAIIETATNTLIAGCMNTTIPESVTSIGVGAFAECSGLTSITIPESVTSIGEYAFWGCSGLTSVTIPESVTSIGEGAFAWCSGLTSITIPNGVTTIGNSAFYNCSGLTSVTIPNSVTSIGIYAFRDCSSLTSVTIGNGVTSIGSRAFYNCSNIASLCIDCDSIGEWFSDIRESLQTLTLGDHVRIIGPSAFSGYSGLTSVNIPESVTSIGSYAFQNCSGLTSITIPESVTSIGGSAFYGCSGLTSVITKNTTPVVIGEQVFTNRANAVLYVPVGCMSAYETADYWKEFKEILDADVLETDSIIQLANASIMASAIHGDFMDMYYSSFIQDNNNISLFLPTDDALLLYYDPASMKSRTPCAISFSPASGSFPVKHRLYSYTCPYNQVGGTIGTVGRRIVDTYTNDVVVNRLKDIIESHIMLRDGNNTFDPQQEYFLSKNGCPIKVIRDKGGNVISVKGGFQLENERLGIDQSVAAPGVLSCPVDTMYIMNKGRTYVLNAPLVPTYRSVYSIFTNDQDQFAVDKVGFGGETPYSAFYDLCTADAYETEIIGCGLVDRNLSRTQRESALKKFMIFIGDKGLDYNVEFFNNNNYTIFVPTNEAVQDAIDHGLPTWEEISEDFRSHLKPEMEENEDGTAWVIKYDEDGEIVYTDSLRTYEDSVRIAAKITYLTNFVRNHFACNSVFADKNVLAHQEMVTACRDWETGQFCKIHVDRVSNGDGTELRVCDDVTWKKNGNSMTESFATLATDSEGRDLKNILARDISCNMQPVGISMRDVVIDYSSTAVIHSIPACLNHTKLVDGRHDKTWEAAISNWDWDSIKEIQSKNEVGPNAIEGTYDLSGRKLTTPQRGINIIRYSDGSTRKVLIK